MDNQALWEQSLLLVSHAYFERKEKFELSADTYPLWMLFAVEGGNFRYRIGAESGEAGAGDLIYCPPGIAFHREMGLPLQLHLIGFELSGPPQQQAASRLPSFKSNPTDGKWLASDLAYLRRLHLAIDPRSTRRKQMMLNDIWQLSSELWEEEHRQEEWSRLTDADDPLMNRAAEWLCQHAYAPFSMSGLAAWLGLSSVQFTRRFRKVFRKTPSAALRSLRIRSRPADRDRADASSNRRALRLLERLLFEPCVYANYGHEPCQIPGTLPGMKDRARPIPQADAECNRTANRSTSHRHGRSWSRKCCAGRRRSIRPPSAP